MEQCRILVDCGWTGTNELVADQGRDLWSDPLMAATSDREEQYKLQISGLTFNQLLDLSEIDVLRWIGLFVSRCGLGFTHSWFVALRSSH